MTNLNPNGTGTLLPNQYTNKDLSFVPPPPSQLGPSVSDSPEGYTIDQETPPGNRPQIVDLSKILGNDYKGCYWWRIALNFNGFGYKQVGMYSKVNGKRSDGALVADMPWQLCLPSLTTNQGAGTPPGAVIDRMCSAVAFGVQLISGNDPAGPDLYRETSTSNPVIIQVAGYVGTVPGGNANINAIRVILVNGTQYLAICFNTTTGANTVQILSNLNNPPTSATVPTGAVPTYDLIQTSIDGNALLLYMGDGAGNGVIRAIRTDVGVGTVALSAARCQLPPGGYAVGLSEAEDNDTMAYWVVPIDGNYMTFNIQTSSLTAHGKLIKTDARGYLPVTVDSPLRWVTYATKCRGGIVICDTVTHWYLNKHNPRGKWRRMGVFDEFPANSNIGYYCCGHHEKDGKFLVETNEVAVLASSDATKRYAVEWDFDKWEANRVEAKQTTGAVNLFATKGGAHLPWSPYTNYKHIREETSWIRQPILPLGQDLYDARKTTGAAAGTGMEYAGEESLTWPVMDIDGLEDCVKTITAIRGPKPAAVATGGTGAYVLIEELLSGRTGTGPNGQGQTFYGTEPAQRVQDREYKTPSWTYQIQPRITIVRQSGGTDPTRLTPNAFNNQIFIEGVAVRDSVALSSAQSAMILKAMDRQKRLPTP